MSKTDANGMPFPDIGKIFHEEQRAKFDQLALERGFEDPDKVVVDHEDFAYTVNGGAHGYPVVVFLRSEYYTPTNELLADYNRRREIVRENGGVMILAQWQIGGRRPAYTEKDVEYMLMKTRKVLPPGWGIRDFWNGVGTYTFSISVCKENG